MVWAPMTTPTIWVSKREEIGGQHVSIWRMAAAKTCLGSWVRQARRDIPPCCRSCLADLFWSRPTLFWWCEGISNGNYQMNTLIFPQIRLNMYMDRQRASAIQHYPSVIHPFVQAEREGEESKKWVCGGVGVILYVLSWRCFANTSGLAYISPDLGTY